MIARKAKCPVMPVYMDGLWGSIFSYERGRMFKKIPYSVPYGVTVAWGEPILPRMASSVAVRKALHQLSSESIEMRDILINPSRLLAKKFELLDGDQKAFTAMLESVKAMDDGQQRALITNALQVAESPAFSKRGVIVVDSKDETALIFAIGLPLVHQVRVLLADEYT